MTQSFSKLSIGSIVPLRHGWRFFRGEVPEAYQISFNDSSWCPVSVPHSFNAQDTFLPQRGYYRGPAWYRMTLPELQDQAHIELVSLGAFALTDVWMNEEYAGQYMGGFTGFCSDLTPLIKPGGPNVLALRVSNEHDPEILPGKEIPDYNLYGGLYREVFLRVVPLCHIPHEGVTLTTPQVSAESGTVEVQVAVLNETDVAARRSIEVSIRKRHGQNLCSVRRMFEIPAKGRSHETLVCAVDRPDLWSPETPHLYEAEVTLSSEEATPPSPSPPPSGGEGMCCNVSFGFRWFDFDPDKGFLLNGRPLRLRGVNRHQDFPGLGNALPASMQSYDVRLIREIGGNFVRCSHYPMHPAFLDACDEQGVLVYEEIASWQHIGGARFARNAKAMMEEMIQRDRHHPSIILWGLLNEGRDPHLFRELHETAKRMDPSRKTIYAENSPDKGLPLGTVVIPDVLGLNYLVEKLDELRALLPGVKLLSSEHTNADFARRGDLKDEIEQMNRVLHNLNEFESRDWIAGTSLWSMHDYGTDYGVVWPMQKSGIWDAWRLPKAGVHALRARWLQEPFIKILGHWTHAGKDGLPIQVTVVSNAEKVDLRLNGRSLGQRSAQHGFVWTVPYEPGELKAEGRYRSLEVMNVKKTASSDQRTWRVQLESLDPEIPANGVDVTLITASIVDEDGELCPEFERPVSFSASLDGHPGGAEFLGVGGLRGLTVRAGQGRMVLRAGKRAGQLLVTAESPALQEGSIQIRLIPDRLSPSRERL